MLELVLTIINLYKSVKNKKHGQDLIQRSIFGFQYSILIILNLMHYIIHFDLNYIFSQLMKQL